MIDLFAKGQALQMVIGDLSTLAVHDLVQLFGGAGGDPGQVRTAFGAIVRPYVHAAATVAAQWYNELAPDSKFRATPISDLPDEQVHKTVNWAFNGRGKTGPLDRLAGKSQNLVAGGARNTVVDNAADEGVAWGRLAAVDACAFCRALALRGPVYEGYGVKTDELGIPRLVVVGRVGRRGPTGRRRGDEKVDGVYRHRPGSRPIGSDYHDCCRCIAVPSRAGTVWTSPDYYSDWGDEYDEAVKRAGGHHNFKKILAEMRAIRREQDSGNADTEVHDHPPVDLDVPVR